jgi:hypothetical protein
MAKANPDPKPWRAAEINLIKGTLRARQAEDDRRAKSWFADREAELEAVVNRSYDGSDVPGIPERVAKAQALVEPIFDEIRALFQAAFPAESNGDWHCHHTRRHTSGPPPAGAAGRDGAPAKPLPQ